MARVNRGSARGLSTDKPVLTGESRSDHALWQLAVILAEIAEQVIQDEKNRRGEYKEVNDGKRAMVTEGVAP